MDSDRVVGTAKKVGGKVKEGLGDLTGDDGTQLDGAVDQVKGAAQAAYGQAKDAVRDYADQAGEVANRAYEQGKRYVDQGRERYPDAERYYREGSKAISRQVEESPFVAIVIAGAVGYLLAVLIHGRK